jgi:cardiolipin synthase (CMP-forming)
MLTVFPLSYVPNLITIGRLMMVPMVIMSIINGAWGWAFASFVIAGASDGLDGFLARRFHWRSELGAHLDAFADKALLMSIYLTLAVAGIVPIWLAVCVVFRDLMIMGAVVIAWLIGRPVPIRPLKISKTNTMVQICFAASVLATKAFAWTWQDWFEPCVALTAGLTLISAAVYLINWLSHMSKEISA